MRIFYSWQSDVHGNRQYIQDCLEQAVSGRTDVEIETATRNAPGAVDIAATIQTKINECDLFVADVSIIGETTSGRKTPNPNVMYELGYAIAKKGDGAIILVANRVSTVTADLPFDIRNRLILLKEFDHAHKAGMASELASIITNHQTLATETETLEHPYIYLQLQGYTNNGSEHDIRFATVNNETDEYVLEAIELGGIEVELRRAIQAGTSRPFPVTGLPVVPFYTAYGAMSFVVNRMNRTYLITQEVHVSGRADERFNFDSLDPTPARIQQIPKRRNATTIMLARAGSNLKLSLTDTSTGNSYVVGVSDTLLRMWGLSAGYDEKALVRIAKSLNDQLQGHGEGEYMFISTNSGNTVNSTVELIFNGTVSFNQQT